MRTASLRTTLVGVFLAATLSGTAPDIFVRCTARGRPGGALLVEGGAELICELSGTLKKVWQYAENFYKNHGFSCLRDVAQRVKDSAEALTYKIDDFIFEFEKGNWEDVICLAETNTRRNEATYTKDGGKLSGCHKRRYDNNAFIDDLEKELNGKIEIFSGVGGGTGWKNGVSDVFGTDARGPGCPLTLHEASFRTDCKGKLHRYSTPYGGLWEIKGVNYERCSEHDCSCSDYYSPEPKIYWIGDDDNDYANMLRTLREDLKTLKEADESKCIKRAMEPTRSPQTQLHENSDNEVSHANISDNVHGNAGGIETEQHTGGGFGAADTNATVVAENHGEPRARSETSHHGSRNNDSNSMRASTDDNASTVPAQNSPLYTDIHISSSCHLGGVIFVFAGIFFGKTFILSPMR
ncbi:hypothetical protein ERJ75_000454600 [Trypanosoma vivax]|uniref:Uncharacterized protein n=1 Tax=Trypanosoma vivax (strain Y486) TaxID=1055687 RepID=F9WR00_TRYVY|nr:hypothetical protein ERJ75_000454600 [Trypanosoma vivax]CCD19983.1 hypothetical protein TvY486_0027380 [Trypanosoma vivax Y486]|eukprot:CCD19983.1 hypothetical protein TvY486_0027380 [Trypanosoma vivax Y486]